MYNGASLIEKHLRTTRVCGEGWIFAGCVWKGKCYRMNEKCPTNHQRTVLTTTHGIVKNELISSYPVQEHARTRAAALTPTPTLG